MYANDGEICYRTVLELLISNNIQIKNEKWQLWTQKVEENTVCFIDSGIFLPSGSVGQA